MRRTIVMLLVVGLVAVATGPAITSGDARFQQSTPENQSAPFGPEVLPSSGEITYFQMEGRGYVSNQDEILRDPPDYTYVWGGESLELQVTVNVRNSNRTKAVCGRVLDEEHEELDSIECTSWNSTSSYRRVSLTLPEWPDDATGRHYVEVEFVEETPASSGENGSTDGDNASRSEVVHDTHLAEVYVLGKQGDLSGNGLSNAREVSYGTDFTRADTDGDGIPDWEEIHQYGSNPRQADTSGDGIEDGTVASIGLPPTVPYLLHAVVVGTVVVAIGLCVLVLRAWAWLQAVRVTTVESPSASPPDETAEPLVDRPPDSKEDEVFHVLREHGGQMRQSDLVDETEWSKATVSRLLSTLEDEGRIEKIRVGRGNVVRVVEESLPNGDLSGNAAHDGGTDVKDDR